MSWLNLACRIILLGKETGYFGIYLSFEFQKLVIFPSLFLPQSKKSKEHLSNI